MVILPLMHLLLWKQGRCTRSLAESLLLFNLVPSHPLPCALQYIPGSMS
jgi:hypothetical protein